MSDALSSELLSALFKLATLQLRLGIIATEAILALFRVPDHRGRAEHEEIEMELSDVEIDAAAIAIDERLVRGHELGFQCLLRTNFPRDAIREMAIAALMAARKARDA